MEANPWKLNGQKRVVKYAEQTGKTTSIRHIAVRETSALRYDGDPNNDHHCTMVSMGQRVPQLGVRITSL